MSGLDEISSTEKLLRVIRSGDRADTASTIRSNQRPDIKPFIMSPNKRKPGVLGVEIGLSSLHLVKIGRKQQILGAQSIPFDAGLDRGNPDFHHFLKAALVEFSGSSRNTEVWTAVSSAFADLRLIRIPKLPRSQIPNAVFWTLKREFPFNEKETVFDYEIVGEVMDDGVRKMEVLAYTAPIREVDDLRALFGRVDFPLAGITAAPFAFRNILRAGLLESTEGGLCTLHVDRTWSRIDIFSGKNLVLSRNVRAGMNGMVQGIGEMLRGNRAWAGSRDELALGLENPDNPEETEIGADDPAWRLFFGYLDNMGSGAGNCFDSGNLFEALKPALERLTRQIERTIEHYDQKIRGPIISKIFTAGRIAACDEILAYIGEQLNLPVERLEPIAVQTNPGLPPNFTETNRSARHMELAPAMGIALSHGDTPNFLFTYKDKAAITRVGRTRRIAAAVCMILMAILGGYYALQEGLLTEKKARIEALKQELDRFHPRIDQASIQKLLEAVTTNKNTLEKFEKRYLTLAVVKELTDLKPSDIRLLSIRTDIGPDQSKASDNRTTAASTAPAKSGTVGIEGVVAGEKAMMESVMAQYLLSLRMSPLFGKSRVKDNSYRSLEGRELLMFSAEIDLK